jgi:hypothetical protein
MEPKRGRSLALQSKHGSTKITERRELRAETNLCELGLAVAAQLLIAEALDNLEVTVNPTHLQDVTGV